tara:strand:- start:22 stop:237 length:216 start_codon:yes stop_codon:yes gene_type:complete
VEKGDLVRIKRASIGVPMDTLALLTAAPFGVPALTKPTTYIYTVQILGPYTGLTRERRYLRRDLEVVSGKR